MDRRVERAYPQRKLKLPTIPKTGVFAQGCGFYKVFLLFSIGSLLGDIIETIFCRLKMGVWMSRSSLVWGPFSIVWGFAFAGVTLLLYRYKDRSDSFLFLTGTFLGGAYEYLCSVLSEIVFGKVFWDYSKMPFNLNGRINLLYCFFWGIATVVWFKRIYPFLSNLIEKLPIAFGTVFTWIIVVFMVLNMFMSLSALIRYDQRDKKYLLLISLNDIWIPIITTRKWNSSILKQRKCIDRGTFTKTSDAEKGNETNILLFHSLFLSFL